MGISGLLPLLKAIHVNKHLSDLAGQTLAVDAYVWLHRGVYACAVDLATGKTTHKYVDYAMYRIRLLRHHQIQPYIVFDGGPLPAKAGTEMDRKQRRDENLAKANSLASAGKHSQAREFYVKCVDVTPEMALQLIKALRAEAVPYLVAPYEADAQMRYLELNGLVDGIITEDSDLLVFGCQHVYFKLDALSATVTSIARSNFGSVQSSEGGLSLLGWNDTQFRHMSILSGCDYLPSIPGIGLKTAYALIKKHRTAEKAIRALQLEGKRDVPLHYMASFISAECAFLHQRVYDPNSKSLVYLTPIPEGKDWDESLEAFVGRDMPPAIAEGIARGDVDPVTFVTIKDINPGFNPRPLKNMPMNKNLVNTMSHKQPELNGGILTKWFKPKSKSLSPQKNKVKQNRHLTTSFGQSSGRRTLVEAAEEARQITQSRYFAGSRRQSTGTMIVPRKQEINSETEKNISRLVIVIDEEDNPPTIISNTRENLMSPAKELTVHQEDGYISPSFSKDGDASDFSSPVRCKNDSGALRHADSDDEALTSPLGPQTVHKAGTRKNTIVMSIPELDSRETALDMRDIFDDDSTSDIESDPVTEHELMPTLHGPNATEETVDMDSELNDNAMGSTLRNRIVAQGWWDKYRHLGIDNASSRMPMRRRDTMPLTSVRFDPIERRSRPPEGRNRSLDDAVGKWPIASHKRIDLKPDVVPDSSFGNLARFRCPI